jgi:glycogen debranching enzyme
MAATGEVPFALLRRVDATPLFCMLLGDYGAQDRRSGLVPSSAACRARSRGWSGTATATGRLRRVPRTSAHGLVNQGWKDSGDAVFIATARPPSRRSRWSRCRVPVRRAPRDGRSPGRDRRGGRRGLAARRRPPRAHQHGLLAPGEDTYALALDRDKKPCAVVASNAGHLLYCGVPDASRAERLAARLLRTDLFGGWGIRTLAAGQARYNPMSYHNGSVWPHDNSLIAAGLRRYGRIEAVLQILGALVAAALQFEDRRLPELFCGFGRRRDAAPVPYPVACRPQAWAAGSVFLLLEAALGLEIDALHRRVVFRQPQLPAWLPWLEVRNLRIGDARLDLHLLRGKYGGSLEIIRKDGDVEVVEAR